MKKKIFFTLLIVASLVAGNTARAYSNDPPFAGPGVAVQRRVENRDLEATEHARKEWGRWWGLANDPRGNPAGAPPATFPVEPSTPGALTTPMNPLPPIAETTAP